MDINENPVAWKLAKEEYEEIKANGGEFADPRMYDEQYESAWKGIEWPCLLFILICLNPSFDDYNPRKARRLIQLLLQGKHFDSTHCLAEYLVIHEDDNPVAREVGMETLRAMADAGHTRSQHLLALFLFDGVGIKQDPEEALRLLTLAADANDSEAQLSLAYKYLYGEGVPRDRATAFRYARKAEELGNDDSFWILWQGELKE